ncbi:hypothetical protein GCM10022217_29930 [Chryseobacterium ginsenosidimutans]|uniref:type II toxin-antitoxin system RelE/ParE family toxin n=1 Tax=Chryseobacterium ginsenosidimutans TaxID=687846 RepID=UPI0033789749
MAVKIFWTDFAKEQLRNIFDYYKLKASPKIAKNLVTGIVEKTNTLDFQKEIGQKKTTSFIKKRKFQISDL